MRSDTFKKDIIDFKNIIDELHLENPESSREGICLFLLKTTHNFMVNLTYEEIGFILKLKVSEVVAIETKVIKKFKDPNVAVKLKDFKYF